MTRRHAPSLSRKRTGGHWSKLHFETLESRQLLTVTSSFADGTLQVSGDEDIEDIVITADGGQTLINGLDPSSGPLAAGSIKHIVVSGGSGTALIDLSAVDENNFPELVDSALSFRGSGGPPRTVLGSQFSDQITDIDGGDSTLNGGAGDDTYAFRGTPNGTVTIVDSPPGSGGGINTLDFSSLTGVKYASGVTLDLASSTNPQTVARNPDPFYSLGLDLSEAEITKVIGSPWDDRITGNSLDNVLQGGPGNDTLDGGPGNDTYVAIDGDGNRDTVIDTAGPDADGLFPAVSPVFAGSPVTFSLVNPSASAHFSFALSEGALATTYSGAGAASTSDPFSFTAAGTHIVWGRVIEADDVYSTFSTQFTVATGLGIAGRVRNDAGNPTTPFDLTLFSTDDVDSSGWVIDWGDGTSSPYTVSPTSASPIIVSHDYPSETGIYQVSATVTDADSNPHSLGPITVEVWGLEPFAPQGVKAEIYAPVSTPTTNRAIVSWEAPFGPTAPYSIEYALKPDGSDGWKPWSNTLGTNYAVGTVSKKYYFRVKFVNGSESSQWSDVVSPIYPAQDRAVTVSATAESSPPKITLSWPSWAVDTAPFTTGYKVLRRVQGTSSWKSTHPGLLPATRTDFDDTNIIEGTVYEYKVTRYTSGSATDWGIGYVAAGIGIPLVDHRGTIILVVDDTFTTSLAENLAQLEEDLVGDGWTVIRHDVSPTDLVANVKSLIKRDYDLDPDNVKQVFLVGHVPVPYSGDLYPDGHPDHRGAWPADAFYGDIDGNWTDYTVDTNGGSNGHANHHYDGVYDQNALAGQFAPELAVGRVDMFGMAVAGGENDPAAELVMLQQYLERDHEFRQGLRPVEKRALVDLNFAAAAYGVGAYREFGGLVGWENVHSAKWFWDVPKSGIDPAGSLWGYADGGGSFTNMSQVGNSDDFLSDTVQPPDHGPSTVVFNILFGSKFGDWNSEQLSEDVFNARNLLRAPLAGPGDGLASVWGSPGSALGDGVTWDFQQMGLGGTIGESIVFSQNGGFTRSALVPMGIEAALMGDPSLRQDIVAPPTNVTAAPAGSDMVVNWFASPDDAVLGYNVYRGTSLDSLVKIKDLETETSYTDPAPGSGPYVYMVRAVKLQEGSSGSYNNASQGAFAYVSTVTGRHIFYNNSAFDGNDAALDTLDDNAIATDKSAYLPGDGLAGPDNATSYSRGINGIMVDIANPGVTITADDFTFKTGADNTPGSWVNAPGPIGFTVRAGAGTGGSDRVEISWDDGAITNTWLEVTVEGNDAAGGLNANTGLAASDVFYFGNKIGDTFTRSPLTALLTRGADEIELRAATHAFGLGVTNTLDFDKNGFLNTNDQIIVRNNVGFLPRIDIAAPRAGPAAPEVPVPLGGDGTSAVGSALAVESADSGMDSPQPAWLNAGPVDPPAGHRSFAPRIEIAINKNVARWHSPADDFDWRAADWVLDDELLDALSVDLLTAHRQPRH